jgi:hypothetical protein
MSKRIKNEQWCVDDLICKIKKGEINKPKFQRKRKWDIIPRKNGSPNPNDRAYIEFLFNTENSVHAITFAEEGTSKQLTSIDGNNRNNAISHFIDKPFDIFDYYLDDINNYIMSLKISDENKEELKNIIKQLSYTQIVNFKYHKYFIENDYEELYAAIQKYRDYFEEYIEQIQQKLKINGTKNFNTHVKINVNIFEGYTISDLCETFEKINKYSSNFTETELLACKLFNECNFTIKDTIFKTELEKSIIELYEDRSEGEVLNCFKFDPSINKMNAYDFIVAFQNLSSKKYEFIHKTDSDGISLYFKLFNALYAYKFTDENVNEFINKINYACDILNAAILSIFNEKINSILFNNTCQNKLKTLKKNNVVILFSSIIGYKQTNKEYVIRSIEKCLLYHFISSDISDPLIRENFKNYDKICYRAGGKYIENLSSQILINPELISKELTTEKFSELIDQLYRETNTPKLMNNKRRKLGFYEKTLMFYYYKIRIPIGMLENKFSIEHICPNSSEWDGELDKDRTGNLIPIIASINTTRGNRHINMYTKTKEGKLFCEFIKDIIPTDEIYDTIVSHSKHPIIKNVELYNKMCAENELKYKQNFIDLLFKI